MGQPDLDGEHAGVQRSGALGRVGAVGVERAPELAGRPVEQRVLALVHAGQVGCSLFGLDLGVRPRSEYGNEQCRRASGRAHGLYATNAASRVNRGDVTGRLAPRLDRYDVRRSLCLAAASSNAEASPAAVRCEAQT